MTFRFRFRYILGIGILFMDGMLGGNIITQALWLGLGFGVIDLIEENKQKK